MSSHTGVRAAIFAAQFIAGAAFAQVWQPPAEIAPPKPTAQAAPAVPAEPPKAAPATASPTAASAEQVSGGDKSKAKDCSAQAYAKGLHGKARKKFRDACKKS